MVQLSVSFEAPAPAFITLQGEALDAYYVYQEDPSDENEAYLADRIYDQCEDHIAAWSSLDSWEVL